MKNSKNNKKKLPSDRSIEAEIIKNTQNAVLFCDAHILRPAKTSYNPISQAQTTSFNQYCIICCFICLCSTGTLFILFFIYFCFSCSKLNQKLSPPLRGGSQSSRCAKPNHMSFKRKKRAHIARFVLPNVPQGSDSLFRFLSYWIKTNFLIGFEQARWKLLATIGATQLAKT